MKASYAALLLVATLTSCLGELVEVDVKVGELTAALANINNRLDIMAANLTKYNEFNSELAANLTRYNNTMNQLAAELNISQTINAQQTANITLYKTVISQLARQTMLLQFGMEEITRTNGDSGVKLLRGREKGPMNYYENGVVGKSYMSIHDHSNYERTVGMGEFMCVLNGVEFMTRHNDYNLRMKHTKRTGFDDFEDVPFPKVPRAVTRKTDVGEQIVEMREWFKAFVDQDYSKRDYRKHFKPVLCYLEGTWTLNDELDAFESDRHHIDATSWFNLQEKVRFAAYTGTKSRLENFANLPTTIMSVNETTGLPEYAQWNYRVLCHVLEEDVPLKELKLADDLAYRVPRDKSLKDLMFSRGARFRFYEYDEDKFKMYTKLDRLMYTIPGMDNIPGNLTQESFGETMYDLGQENKTLLNTGYYHRFFRFGRAGAMGVSTVARGFNDANMWVAQTTQKHVAPMKLKDCENKKWTNITLPNGKIKREKTCRNIDTRFSFAIPLEIIYFTPLLSWNPYKIETGKTFEEVTDNGTRTGSLDVDGAYNGVDRGRYYITPVEFFQGRVENEDKADTVRKAVGVLDKNGVLRKTTASGTKIYLQEIEGVGQVRLRYPIAPVYGEGSPVWKELNALKKVVKIDIGPEPDTPQTVTFTMATTFLDPNRVHSHELTITYDSYRKMIFEGRQYNVETTEEYNHKHLLRIHYLPDSRSFMYTKCDADIECSDGHPQGLTLLTTVDEGTWGQMIGRHGIPQMK